MFGVAAGICSDGTELWWHVVGDGGVGADDGGIRGGAVDGAGPDLFHIGASVRA